MVADSRVVHTRPLHARPAARMAERRKARLCGVGRSARSRARRHAVARRDHGDEHPPRRSTMSEPLRQSEPRQPIERLWPTDAVDFMLGVLTLLVATAFLAILSVDAGSGTFFADECFHAAVVRWIVEHGSLPVRLPEFYSGFAYTYPPLFHLLGATLARFAGL